MAKLVFRNGRWYRGKASPEHLEEDLRQLPASYLTKDTGEEAKIHQLDPPHIRRALAHEQEMHERYDVKKEPVKALQRAPFGEVVPLRQDFIDVEKMFVMKGVIEGQLREIERGERDKPDLVSGRHLWFPENNVNNWVVRKGWAPPDSQRPAHLRGFELNVDLLNIPERIRDYLRERGMDAGYFLKRVLAPKKQSPIIEVE